MPQFVPQFANVHVHRIPEARRHSHLGRDLLDLLGQARRFGESVGGGQMRSKREETRLEGGEESQRVGQLRSPEQVAET